MNPQTCFCLILLLFLYTSAEIQFSAEKAREINTYIIVNYEHRYQTELPGLRTKFDEAALACETQINKTIDTCLACIERNLSSGLSPDTFVFDKVILGVIPTVSDLDNFGNGVKDALEKNLFYFTETNPETVDKIGKEIDKIVTDTVLPKTAKKIGKEIDKIVTDTVLPKTAKKIGKEIDKIVTDTVLPKTAKSIGKEIDKDSSTVPKTAKRIGKEVDKFDSSTVPKTAKKIDKEIDTFLTETLPDTTEIIGKRLDKFFRSTIPNLGKSIGTGFKRFGNTLKGLFGLRRRRETSVCPPCDLIDTEKKTAEDIWRDVCSATVNNIFENKYTNMVRIFRWLKDGNVIVNQVSFRTEDTTIIPLEKVFTVTPFNVTYSIGDGDQPRVYTDTSTILDLYDNTNSLFGHFLADKIWDEYVFGN